MHVDIVEHVAGIVWRCEETRVETAQPKGPDMQAPGTLLVAREGEPFASLRPDDEDRGHDGHEDDFSADVDGYKEEQPAAGGAAPESEALALTEEARTGTEVVYLRDQVAVWPSSRHCILGRLSIITQCSVTFLAWLPYGRPGPGSGPGPGPGGPHASASSGAASCKPAAAKRAAPLPQAAVEKASGLSHAERARYAIHPMPMSEVKALRCRTPLLLVPSLTLVLQDGLSLPPLHFPAGGLRELVACLRKRLDLTQPAGSDRNVYLVNDPADPLPRALATSDSLEAIIGMQQQQQQAQMQAEQQQQQQDPGRNSAAAAAQQAVEQQTSTENTTVGAAPSVVGLEVPAAIATAATAAVATTSQHAADTVSEADTDSASRPACDRVDGSGEASHPAEYCQAEGGGDGDGVGEDENVGGEGQEGGERATPWSRWLAGVQRKLRAAAAAAVTHAASSAAEYMSWQESLAEGDLATAAFYQLLDMEVPGAAAAAAAAAQREGHAGPSTPAAEAATASEAPCSQSPLDAAAAAADKDAAVRPNTPLPAAAEPRAMSRSGSLDGFELVESCVGLPASLPSGAARVQLPPLSADEWQSMFDQGRLVDVDTLRRRAHASGIAPAVRREAWKYLLGLSPLDSTEQERAQLVERRRADYQALRLQWESIGPSQASRFDPWRERCARVNKDARRTDRHLPFYATERGPNVAALRRILLTYAMYNFNLGYCQGMSDLASPLLYVMCDESEAFWCFAALMERVGSHFDEQQSGVQAQLKALGEVIQVLDPPLHSHLESIDALNYFFCFRWLLVLFKREFRVDEVLRLWEASWSCPFTPHLLVYLAAAVLVHHRRDILEQVGPDAGLDGLLRLCCQLPGRLQLEPLLLLAEQLAGYAGKAGVDFGGMAGLPAPPPLAARPIGK